MTRGTSQFFLVVPSTNNKPICNIVCRHVLKRVPLVALLFKADGTSVMMHQAEVRNLRDIVGEGIVARALLLTLPTTAVIHTVGRMLLRQIKGKAKTLTSMRSASRISAWRQEMGSTDRCLRLSFAAARMHQDCWPADTAPSNLD